MQKLTTTVAIVALLASHTAVFAQDKPASITVAAYGGVWAESIKKNIIPCFEEKTGVKVEIATGESADWLAKIRANPSNPPIHIVALAEADSFRAQADGLLDQMTVEKVPNLAQIPDVFHKPWNNYSVAMHYSGLGVLYDKTRMEPPKDWKEFLDKTISGGYGGGVSMPAGTYAWGPEWLWLVSQQYGGSIDEAFARLKAAAGNVPKFWTTPTEAQNLFATHAVDAVVMWDGRANNFIKDNDWAAFTIPKPAGIAGSAMLSKVKNAPDVAYEYLNCALSPEVQAGHAATLLYGVTNPAVKYSDDIAPVITPVEDVVVAPYAEIMKDFPAWVERWNKEMR